jgi:hypothetical protein
MGLSIAQRIIEGYGGGIEVASKVNKGTTFVLSLPTERAGKTKQLTASESHRTVKNTSGDTPLYDAISFSKGV